MGGIAYQNKDILFKILGQTYKEKSFAAYGIDLPRIRALLPTDLPKISANEKSVDNLFLLEDGTYAIVNYETVYKRINKIKYLNYIAKAKAFAMETREQKRRPKKRQER